MCLFFRASLSETSRIIAHFWRPPKMGSPGNPFGDRRVGLWSASASDSFPKFHNPVGANDILSTFFFFPFSLLDFRNGRWASSLRACRVGCFFKRVLLPLRKPRRSVFWIFSSVLSTRNDFWASSRRKWEGVVQIPIADDCTLS